MVTIHTKNLPYQIEHYPRDQTTSQKRGVCYTATLDLELLHTLTTFNWNALGSTLGWWFCHNNTVSGNEKFWVEQVTVPHPPLGKDKGWGRTRGGG